jgi:hypothetical protein
LYIEDAEDREVREDEEEGGVFIVILLLYFLTIPI